MESNNQFLLELTIGVASAAVSLRMLQNRYAAFFAGYAAYALTMIMLVFASSPGGSMNNAVLVPRLSGYLGAYLIPYAISFFLLKKWWNVHERAN